MLATVNRRIGRFEPLGAAKEFIASDRVRPEQKHAPEFVLASCDRAVIIRGAAGAGKTATLAELNRGLAEAGQKAFAVAPTMSAVEELANVGFSECGDDSAPALGSAETGRNLRRRSGGR